MYLAFRTYETSWSNPDKVISFGDSKDPVEELKFRSSKTSKRLYADTKATAPWGIRNKLGLRTCVCNLNNCSGL